MHDYFAYNRYASGVKHMHIRYWNICMKKLLKIVTD